MGGLEAIDSMPEALRKTFVFPWGDSIESRVSVCRKKVASHSKLNEM